MKETENFVEQDVDWKAMYMSMMRASEAAMNLLIEAQRECEELYLAGTEPVLQSLRDAFPEDDT